MGDIDPAITAHATGHFDEALRHCLARFNTMGRNDPARPGLMGEIAFNYDRLGEYWHAVSFADLAYEIERDPTQSEGPGSASLRLAQRPSVELNAGIVYLREAARLRLADHPEAISMQKLATRALTSAWAGITLARWDRPHQHEINAASRLSNLEAVQGNIGQSVKRAVGAIGLGFLSESPSLVDGISGFNRKDRLFAKGKAIARGVGAVGVAALSALPGQKAANARDWLLLKTS